MSTIESDGRTERPEPPETPDERADDKPATAKGVTAAQALRLLSTHLSPRGIPLSIALVLLSFATVMGLALPLAVHQVLDALGAGRSLGSAVGTLVLVILLSAVLQGAGNFVMLRSAEDVVLASRTRLVDRLLSLSLSSMRSQAPGDLMARVTSDTALIRQVANASIVPFVTGGITVTGAVLIMLLMDPLLFLITAVVIAIPSVFLSLVMPRVRTAAQQTQLAVGAMGSALERVLGAFSTVKAAAAEAEESERLGLKARRARDSGVRSAFWSAIAIMTSSLAVQAAFLVVLGMGAFRVQNGSLTVATLIAFLLYAMQLSQPVLQLTQATSAFQLGRAALERIAEVDRMEREAESGTVGDVMDATTGEPAPIARNAPGGVASLGAESWTPAVEFSGATVTYPGAERPAIDGVSLRVPPIGVTAVVGPSGSGKSTVLKVVEGFFPLDDGAVRVAGRDLSEWNLDELRRAVALVEQETPVLAGSLRANLTYGLREPVEDARLFEVLMRIGLGERFSTVEDLDAEFGHRGALLSGGERQRVAIARAMLREPEVLLMDEATSQLDAGNEHLMREVVAWMGTRTAVVLVAHRLSTVVDADQVVLMEDGRVRAVSTHAELLLSDDLYRQMVQQQNL